MMLAAVIETVGKQTLGRVSEAGYLFALFAESVYWLVVGPLIRQPVRIGNVAREMMKIGVLAVPVVALLAFANGVIMAIQGIATLKSFGAETQVVTGIAYSVSREFGVLIAAIVVAGRSGSAIAAHIGSMKLSQEIDALRVIGTEPIRHLVAPVLVAMLIMLPVLTMLANTASMLGGGLYTGLALDISLATFFDRAFEVLVVYDLMQGLIKSIVFGGLIGLIACSKGFSVEGGAEGLGRATTHSVVASIAAIVIADMIFTYFLTR